ncbi:MAG: hypothetical protein EOO77_47500 [Oxalobacteraceae bacterium]|nr:MAG: hypothetical protein EOO77_47500 [Oxalobacteraceae bacterium]
MFEIPEELRFRLASPDHDSIASLLVSHSFPYNFSLIAEHEMVRALEGPVLRDLTHTVTDWCIDQFGERVLPVWDFQGEWTCISITFAFRRPEHATAFKVRWC